MARANVAIGGFRYWGSLFAENVAPRVIPCQVATAYGTGIFKGDPVKRVSDGSVSVSAAGEAVFGVVAGVQYRNADGVLVEKDYVPASTAYTPDRLRTIVMVIPATPFTIFECDANATIASVATARTYVWENVDHVATVAGNTSTGRSGFGLDMSTHNTTSSQWRLYDISPVYGNDPTLVNGKWLVIANETHNWPGTFSTTGI